MTESVRRVCGCGYPIGEHWCDTTQRSAVDVSNWLTLFGRSAAIEMGHMPDGYWAGRVTVTVPQLPEPHVQSGDSFHTADEVIHWAYGVIDLLTRDFTTPLQRREP